MIHRVKIHLTHICGTRSARVSQGYLRECVNDRMMQPENGIYLVPSVMCFKHSVLLYLQEECVV